MCNHPYGFEIYLVNVKTMRKIAHIFVSFSEKLNFMYPQAKTVSPCVITFSVLFNVKMHNFLAGKSKFFEISYVS